MRQGIALPVGLFALADIPTGRWLVRVGMPAGGFFRGGCVAEKAKLGRPAAVGVDDAAAQGGEEEGFDTAAGIKAGAMGEERDERFLHEVFGIGRAAQLAAGEGEQPAVMARDELRPAGLIAGGDLL